MGSGKTTIYKRIMQNSPEIPGFDLDDLVEKKISRESEDLGQAIERVGFSRFREAEKELLFEKLNEEGSSLICLGGGSLSQEVLNFIGNSKDIKLVWLKTDFETCWGRIKNSTERPLVKKGKEALMTLFKEREDLYRRANKIINLEEQSLISRFEELDDECKIKA